MTISLLWLNDYLKTDLTPDQLADALTSIGLEVEKTESWDSIMGGLSGIIAGHVLTCEHHPDADRLSMTTVDVGKESPASIVCGASNVAAGQKVWVALPGTTLYDANGKPWTISISKIRGATSEGMICAEDELGLGKNHDGIMILPDAVHVGTKASEYYKVISDTIFEIGLTPNRSDATSILGVAEDLAAFLTVQGDKIHQVKWPDINPVPDPQDLVEFRVSVGNTDACPRYSGIVISNIQIGPSPDWMQQRLQSIGVKTINNVVDITNFILHEMGQPLHAFDADKISGKEIIVETKPSGTPFLALDGLTYTLYHEDLMICDGQGSPMCIGGVYGGLNSGVSNDTKTVFLEAAHFNAGWVRRTSMRHNLRTEAARRFEKGSDPNITVKALARAAQLLSELAGGTVASGIYDIYPKPILPAQVMLHFATLNAKTGVSFRSEEIMKIVRALNMEVIEKGDHKVLLSIPTNKADVTSEIDVIEEILRIYGFSNIPLPGKMNT
ncbi:MAG: phenylalanine--tRNA ligase subunit beta, partial [Saprospiraceae bacterium]